MKRTVYAAIAGFYLLSGCLQGSGQQPVLAATDTSVLTGVQLQVSASAGYVLEAGDQLTIHVGDLDELADKTVHIDPDGEIDLPLIGRVQAAGSTLVQLKATLSQKLGKYIATPEISLNLVETSGRAVSVVGEVNQPGLRPLPGPRTLVEVLSLAGGVKQDAGPTVILTRASQRGPLPLADAHPDSTGKFNTAAVSLDDLLGGRVPADNVEVQPGDIISVPRGDVVYVVGDVKRAGGFPLASHPSISLLQALSLAEGLGPDAASKNAKILRPVASSPNKPKEIPVDVKAIFAGKAEDLPLYANDILFIPNSAAKSGGRRAIEAAVQVATGVAVFSR